MKQIFFSVKLLVFGAFCDMCAAFCTYLAERCISHNKSLNKKLLIFMSNFSDNNLVRWQAFEKRFLCLFIDNARRLP